MKEKNKKRLLSKALSGALTAKQLVDASIPVRWRLTIELAGKEEDTVYVLTNSKGLDKTFSHSDWQENKHLYKDVLSANPGIGLIDELDAIDESS
jgi:hypothetical protein